MFIFAFFFLLVCGGLFIYLFIYLLKTEAVAFASH